MAARTGTRGRTAETFALQLVVLMSCLRNGRCPLPGQHSNGPAESLVPLVEACVQSNLTQVEALLAAGADPNERDVVTPLYACQEYMRSSKQRHAAIRNLLRAGALPDKTTNDGSTPLMLAAYHGDVRSVRMLLERGADPLLRNHGDGCGEDGCNAIDAAGKGRHRELQEMLREHLGESALRMGTAPSIPKQEL